MSYNKIIVGIGMLVMCQYSCTSGTPAKYKNKTMVSVDIYNNNKRVLTDSIREFILTHTSAYYPDYNDSLTEIFIDTILYSPLKDKIAFFVITKKTSDKLLDYRYGDKIIDYYDAHCFIAYLKNDTIINGISWIRYYNLTNYKNYQETSNRIREIYFKELPNQVKAWQYGLDDVRFWKSKIWNKYIE